MNMITHRLGRTAVSICVRATSWVLATSIVSAAIVSAAIGAEPSFEFELIGETSIPGDRRDGSGITQTLEDGSTADRLGGFSAIEYSGQGDRFWLLADRGAGDGAVSYPCRVHQADLTVDPASGRIDFELVGTTMLTAADGTPLVGSLRAQAADVAAGGDAFTAMDPEGLRVLPGGALLISEEYGPRVCVFQREGRLSHVLPVPAEFTLITDPRTDRVGTYMNRGLEGIAISPDGSRIVAVPQSPLVQDAQIVKDKCLGINCRWLVYDADRQLHKQVVYPLADKTAGVSEVLAIDADRYLVLERDSKDGPTAKIKRVYLADLTGADDVTSIPSLPVDGVPPGVGVVQKTLVLDLLDPRWGIAGETAPEKPEGLAWGRPLADGRRTLWIACDNDFDPSRQSRLFCFAVR